MPIVASSFTRAQPASSMVVSLDDVEEDPHNARQVFDKAKLQALADSIKAQGILQAPAARLLPSGKYRLIDGHRRCRAAKLAGLKEIRVDVVDLDDQAAAVAAATANLQREDLTPYEQARAFKAALDLGMTKKELGERAGVVFNTIKARLELLELPEAVGQRLDRDGWTIQHAQAFIGLPADLVDTALADKDLQRNVKDGYAYNMSSQVAQALSGANKARQLGSGFPSWEHPGLVKQLEKLPHVKVGVGNRQTVFITDVKAYDTAVEKALADKKAKEAAARAKHATSPAGQAEKGLKAKEKRQRELDQLAEKEGQRLAFAGMVSTLREDKHVPDAIFAVLRELESNDGLTNIGGYGVDAGTGERVWKAAGAAAGADVEAIGAWLDKDGDMGKGTPAWFTKLKPGRQLAFVAAILGSNELLGHPSKEISVALTGKKPEEWLAKGKKEAQRTLDATATTKAKAAGPDNRPCDDATHINWTEACCKGKHDKCEGTAHSGDADCQVNWRTGHPKAGSMTYSCAGCKPCACPHHGAKKPAKGTPKTAAKAKGKAKKPAKVTPAVAKALATLEKAKPSKVVKGKQAALPSAAVPEPVATEPVQVAS